MICAPTNQGYPNFYNQPQSMVVSFERPIGNCWGSDEVEIRDQVPVQARSWESQFDSNSGTFEFSPGLESKQIKALPLDKARKEKSLKPVFSAIRKDRGKSISQLDKAGELEIVHNPADKSLAVKSSFTTESYQKVYVVDGDSQKWLGHWNVNDEGGKAWVPA